MNIPRHYLSGCIKSVVTTIFKSTRVTTMSGSQVVMRSSRANSEAQRIVWIDLEMTGLDIDKDHIMEIACLITDSELNIVATGPNIIIHQPDHILYNMNQWCISQHGESGLTEACRQSKISVDDAEKEMLSFVKAHVPPKRCPLGGNTVYMDRLFIRKFMPTLDSYLHYRIIDVSTIKELAKRWYKDDFYKIRSKKFEHRCMSDIKESIEELKLYRESFFKL